MAGESTLPLEALSADLRAFFVQTDADGVDTLRDTSKPSRLKFIAENTTLQRLRLEKAPEWTDERWFDSVDRRLHTHLNKKRRHLADVGIWGIPTGAVQPGRDERGRFAGTAGEAAATAAARRPPAGRRPAARCRSAAPGSELSADKPHPSHPPTPHLQSPLNCTR